MLMTMLNKELHNLPVIQAVIEKRLRRRDAASQFDLTERQVQRLLNRYCDYGVGARRGKPGTHRIDETLRHAIKVSFKTLQCWMVADVLWIQYARRQPRVYQPLHRHECHSEQNQIDGSHYVCLEGRAPKCYLLV